MKRYFFLHPKTRLILNISGGRSLWEDYSDKRDFIVVKEVGPAMEHWKEAMEEPESVKIRKQAIDECIETLGGRYGAAATQDLRALKDKK